MAKDWRHRAACLDEDPELFFPVGTSGPALEQLAEAKMVCGWCPVREECLAWALASGQEAGVWGGLSEDERRALKRREGRLVHRVVRKYCNGSEQHLRTKHNTRTDPSGREICTDCDSKQARAALARDRYAAQDARDASGL
jgi:WhiB family redox-sensing transcriptional regulator